MLYAKWFSIDDRGLERRVQLSPDEQKRFFSVAELAGSPLPEDGWQGQTVLIDGPSAVWIYALAAVHAAAHGAAVIRVKQADGVPTEIFPVPDGESAHDCFSLTETSPGVFSLHFQPVPVALKKKWPTDVLPAFRRELSGRVKGQLLMIEGRGSNWMYAAAAVAAWQAEAEYIVTVSGRAEHPGTGSLIYGEPVLPRLAPLPDTKQAKDGVIVGVVGDPCSGKSVFSHALEALLAERRQHTWVLDCDGQAPTSDWYMNMMREGKEQEARVLRDQSKRNWTSEMEGIIARFMDTIREKYPIVIADLPGGIHKTDPEFHLRLPPGRERMMRKVNYFIVLGREHDPMIIEGWKQELAWHGLVDRIIAGLISQDPGASPSAGIETNGKQFAGWICGLDRERSRNDLVSGLTVPLAGLLDALCALTGRAPDEV